ncbi:ANTAR domain-containing protein [Streptomyces sp. DSM 42041]|uniref:ANTAR domain-containing protein n=1 Tax=Streptomyces hazeniae TaxID=3075538 RepID=A0ABU2P0A5_9ACTN|nr:ANTAR domain-containing protein [Streptomyces sp. DSM 42041]MDT0382685.1 ANTAR domain-containing protein [Streptomyces sp. DSM 42041]
MSTSAHIAPCAARRPDRLRSPSAAPRGRAVEREAIQQREEIAQLREALVSRPVIDQAMGVLMVLNSVSDKTAWQALVHVSQHTNIKIRSLAAQIVAAASGGPALSDSVRTVVSRAMVEYAEQP